MTSTASAAELKSRYDVVILGGGLKQSLLAGCSQHCGKEVLQLPIVYVLRH